MVTPTLLPETLFRTIVEQAPASIRIYAPDGTCLYVNPAWERLWGVSLDEIGGYNVLHDQQLVERGIMPYIARAFAGEHVTVPVFKYEPDHHQRVPYRWIESTAYPLKDEHGQVSLIVILGVDVTARMDAEAQLQEKVAQYSSIFATTSDGLGIWDMNGVVVEANPAYCRMLGYDYDELIGMHARQLAHPDDLAWLSEAFARVQSSGVPFEGVARALRKDGTAFPAEGRATPFTYKGAPHLLVVTHDITERVRAHELLEQRVEERTRELRTLLDVSHNVASTLDLHDLLGVILDELKAVVEYTGAGIAMQDGDEVRIIGYRGPGPGAVALGTRISVEAASPLWPLMRRADPIIIDDVRDATAPAGLYRETVRDALDTGFGHVRSWMAIPMRVKDQDIGSLFLEHDVPRYYTAHHADLTLAIARQAAIAIVNARLYERAQEAATLEERQRLARELHDSVSQALYGIALGARTARAMLDRAPDGAAEPLDYVLSLAEAGLAEMRALIFELLPEALETEGLVAALGKQTAAVQARHGLAITTRLDREPAATLAVKEALYRIAQEALHNIVKHARARNVQLRLEESAHELVLDVSDDGVGFAATGSFPGHLGLHTMRDRATRLGGTLEIVSAPGSGTCIRVRLPAAGAS